MPGQHHQKQLLSTESCHRSSVSQQDLLRLSRYGTLQRLAAGDVLWKQNSAGEALALVLAGELVSLRARDLGNHRLVLGRHHKGAVVGAAAVLGGREHPVSIEAREASTVLLLTCEQLQRLAVDDPQFGLRLQAQLWHAAAHQIDALLDRLATLS